MGLNPKLDVGCWMLDVGCCVVRSTVFESQIPLSLSMFTRVRFYVYFNSLSVCASFFFFFFYLRDTCRDLFPIGLCGFIVVF